MSYLKALHVTTATNTVLMSTLITVTCSQLPLVVIAKYALFYPSWMLPVKLQTNIHVFNVHLLATNT